MQDQLHDTVRSLNRIKSLYDFSIRYSSPYRIGRIRNLFEKALHDAKGKYEIKTFDTQNYNQLFRAHDKLDLMRSKKISAIASNDYESAALIRDQERRILRSLLSSIGIRESDQFFVNEGRIYKIE